MAVALLFGIELNSSALLDHSPVPSLRTLSALGC